MAHGPLVLVLSWELFLTFQGSCFFFPTNLLYLKRQSGPFSYVAAMWIKIYNSLVCVHMRLRTTRPKDKSVQDNSAHKKVAQDNSAQVVLISEDNSSQIAPNFTRTLGPWKWDQAPQCVKNYWMVVFLLLCTWWIKSICRCLRSDR